MFKINDKVRNKVSGSVGTVMQVNLVGMPDCVLVKFYPQQMDGVCVRKSQLEKVQ